MFSFLATTAAFVLGPILGASAINVSNVLIYSATAGFRHDSIPTAVESLSKLGSSYGVNFVNTEDQTKFNDEYLSQFDALFFLHNTDEGAF